MNSRKTSKMEKYTKKIVDHQIKAENMQNWEKGNIVNAA